MPIQSPLTSRQHAILRNVASGKTNKDIAAQLGISEQGVKVHISRLLERYGARNRVELITLTKAWPQSDVSGYAELSMHGSAHKALAQQPRLNGHALPGTDIAAEVRSLREALGEINVALKLARELPADSDVGRLVDAIRTRVGAALVRSSRLDDLIDRESAAARRSRQSAD